MQALPIGDKEIASEILMTEKRMAEMLVRATLEAMPGRVRNELQRATDETVRSAEHVFNYMNRRNWYNPRNADPQTVSWFRSAVDRMRNDLGSIWASRAGRFATMPAGPGPGGDGGWGQPGPGPAWNRPDLRPGEPAPAAGPGYGWPDPGGFRPGGPGI
ncbi:MAG: spore coat protein [Bacillota bacterium]|nr:spore coat protein [Bacillota bacterium]